MKIRNAITFLLTTLLAGCAGDRTEETEVNPERIRQAVESTMGAWSDGSLKQESWPETLRELDPLEVYSDRANAVIVLAREGGVERGIYVYVMISSYLPSDDDEWQFTPIGGSVWRYNKNIGEP